MIKFTWMFAIIGFVAQFIDGALGMAYGVISNSLCLSVGVTPALSSMIVHAAEIPLTGISGFSHWRCGNVDWKLVRRLVLPGVMSGMMGAYVLSNIPGKLIKMPIAAYLFAVGVFIFVKAIQRRLENREPRRVELLAFVGGFLDAIGGGGWGPVVTSHLIVQGVTPARVIGSVNLSEFFVTLAESVTFLLIFGGLSADQLGLIVSLFVGGVCAAPFAAWVTSKANMRALQLAVGALLCLTCGRTLVLWFLK